MSDSLPSIEPQERIVTLEQLATILVRHFQLHEGRYELGVGLRLGMGMVPGPHGSTQAPGAFVGVEGVSLRLSQRDKDGDLVVDAAVVNPAVKKLPKIRSKKSREARV
jgi:hypothetical protein